MEREEGELTDEDLEEISDNSSLSMMILGKSPLSTREPFRELSLTSVSDESEVTYRVITKSRDVCHKRRCREERKTSGTKRVRKISERRVVRRKTSSFHKDYSSVSSSSDDSDYYKQDKHILRQLRDAVRINRSQKLPNCSLSTRIKRMIEPDSGSKNSNSEDENDLNTLRDLALQSKTKKESEAPMTDKDLIELRLIALQSAVLKKHQNRRKNKEEQMKKLAEANEQNKADASIKENKNTAESVENEKIKNADSDKTTDDKAIDDKKVDEDEAFLRAMLLSGVPNPDDKSDNEKIAKKANSNENDAILHAMLISSIYNNNTDTPQSNQENIVDNNSNTTSEKVENTKTNIDEDEDILRAMLLANISKKISNKKSVLTKNNSNTIAVKTATNSDTKNTVKPSVPVNRFIINLNSDSDSDCDHSIKPEKKKSDAKNTDLFNKSLSLFLQQARAKSDAERKSDISHLPKSQQLEYRRLKRKLQQLTRSRLKTAKPKNALPIESNKLKLVNKNIRKDSTILESKSVEPPREENQLNSHVESYRLEVKGKYEELGPLMTRVSDARVIRDKAQAEVKRLINDLRTAREDLTTTHRTYTTLMQQLVQEKSKIDKRLDNKEEETVKTDSPPICTSTPIKVALQDITCELSAINESGQAEEKEKSDEDEQNISEKTVVPDPEDMDIETPVEEEKKECTILKYSSPLDHIQINSEHPDSNPLTILCPYDLLGVCRDPDCLFRHCGTNRAEL